MSSVSSQRCTMGNRASICFARIRNRSHACEISVSHAFRSPCRIASRSKPICVVCPGIIGFQGSTRWSSEDRSRQSSPMQLAPDNQAVIEGGPRAALMAGWSSLHLSQELFGIWMLSRSTRHPPCLFALRVDTKKRDKIFWMLDIPITSTDNGRESFGGISDSDSKRVETPHRPVNKMNGYEPIAVSSKLRPSICK